MVAEGELETHGRLWLWPSGGTQTWDAERR